MCNPNSRSILYTRKHTWGKITHRGCVQVGVSDFICECKSLKEVASIWTENIGKHVKQMEPFGVLETWWFMFDLYAPFSGLLKALNQEILENPSLIGEDPYDSGWIAEIVPAKHGEEAKALLKSAQYTRYCTELCLACPKKNCKSPHR